MNEYKRIIHPREVVDIVAYDNMGNEDRDNFFKGYDYNRGDGYYHLVNKSYVDKIINKERIMVEDNPFDL